MTLKNAYQAHQSGSNDVEMPLLRPEVLKLLACPTCRSELVMRSEDQGLYCVQCEAIYPIRQHIPHFIQTDELTGLNRRFAGMYNWFSWFYRLFSKVAFATIGMPEAEARREVLDRLEPDGGRVLEVSIGPGVNLPYLLGRQDVGEVYGLDISLGQLQRCQDFAAKKGWPIELFLGNAETLPFQDECFESVFHIGGINFFNNQRKAIDEMIRVAKPGARILIADENEKGARAYESIIPGFKRNFNGQRQAIRPPVDLLSPAMQEVRVFDIWKGWLYCLEFRKP